MRTMTRQLTIGLLALAGISLLGAGVVEPPKPDSPQRGGMTIRSLQTILEETVQNLKGNNDQWRFTFAGVEMALLTNVAHDRLRIVSPILPETEVTDLQRTQMLEANFHTTLDARYATSQGVVYAAYIHPLSPLKRTEVHSALRQVAELVKTFGTTYSSGSLSFGSPQPPADPEPRQQEKKSYD